jgi:hypothetical protein
MQISIKTNFAGVQKALDDMQKGVREKALASAMNKTIEQARTQMTREITQEFAVDRGYVRDRLRIRRASFKAGVFGMSAELDGSQKKRSANLIRFADRFTTLARIRKAAKEGKKPQMQFKIKRVGGKKVITGAFVGNNGRTVFIRTTDNRLPIKALQTIDVGQMFNTKRINAVVVRTLREKFPEVFEREARYFTDKFNSKG